MFEEFGMIEIIDGATTIPKWEKHQNIDGLERLGNKLGNVLLVIDKTKSTNYRRATTRFRL